MIASLSGTIFELMRKGYPRDASSAVMTGVNLAASKKAATRHQLCYTNRSTRGVCPGRLSAEPQAASTLVYKVSYMNLRDLHRRHKA
jgi:hypothetical protein